MTKADLHGARGDVAQERQVAQHVNDQRRAPHRALALQLALPLVDWAGDAWDGVSAICGSSRALGIHIHFRLVTDNAYTSRFVHSQGAAGRGCSHQQHLKNDRQGICTCKATKGVLRNRQNKNIWCTQAAHCGPGRLPRQCWTAASQRQLVGAPEQLVALQVVDHAGVKQLLHKLGLLA